MNFYVGLFLLGLAFGLLFKAKIGLNIENVVIYDKGEEDESRELLNKVKAKVKGEIQ